MTTEKKNDCLINGVQYNCRTCFDPGRTTYSLTEKASNAKTWREVLKDIAQLQTNDDELLPKTLCCTCLEKLKNSYDFVLQIQDVNKKYLEILTKDDGVSNDADNFTDCLAESAIALPLEQYMPEIKLEDEMVVSYDIDMSNNKLAEDDEDKFDNEDTDDPFTEIYDEDHISTSERLEENERVYKDADTLGAFEKPSCSHTGNSKFQCKNFCELDCVKNRQLLYKNEHKIAQDIYLSKLIYTKKPRQNSNSLVQSIKQKNKTSKYYLIKNHKRELVCKAYFMQVLSITRRRIEFLLKRIVNGGIPTERRGGDHRSHKFIEKKGKCKPIH